MKLMIILVLVLLGLCLGSFVNALVWRLHEQGKHKNKKVPKELSISQGRSMCPDCHHQLGFWDLLPVLSWLWLKGKCRYCRKPISWQYPLVEVVTAGLFVLSYAVWPFEWQASGVVQFVLWLSLLTLFMAMTVYDLRWQILPNKLVYPAGYLVVLQLVALSIVQEDAQLIMTAIIGAVCLGGLFYLLYQLSRGTWIGGGDVRLGVVIGLLVGGPSSAVLLLFIASATGTIVALPGLVNKKTALKTRVAFGPFLIFAAVVVYLFGTALVNWYKKTFLLL